MSIETIQHPTPSHHTEHLTLASGAETYLIIAALVAGVFGFIRAVHPKLDEGNDANGDISAHDFSPSMEQWINQKVEQQKRPGTEY